MFLRAGGHVFALKEMLGHTTLTMTMRYAMIAQADVQAQHAQFSPVDHLKRRR
jgi:site-specific recombinase XerD